MTIFTPELTKKFEAILKKLHDEYGLPKNIRVMFYDVNAPKEELIARLREME